MAEEASVRPVSPDVTRVIWEAIGRLEDNEQPATDDALFTELSSEYESKTALEDRLYSVQNARLLTQIAHPVTGQTVYTVPPTAEQPQDHPSDDGLAKNLENILIFLHNKGGSALSSPRQQCGLSEQQYAETVGGRHVDLDTIRQKVDGRQYGTPAHFLVDFQQLCHNVIAVFGKDSPTFNLVRDLSKQVQAEIDQLDRSSSGGGGGVPSASLISAGGDATSSVEPRQPAAARRLTGLKRPADGAGVGAPTDKRVRPPTDVGAVVGPNEQVVEWSMDERFKQMIMELQRYWLAEYQQSREKLLVEMTEKLHQEFLSDQQKIRTELLTQFKDELDATRQELEQKYRDTLKQELHKLQERHRREISNCKKKQWCWQCESEAIYHCCWNTAYCSVECQQAHWSTHRKYCRRKKSNPTGAPNQGLGSGSLAT